MIFSAPSSTNRFLARVFFGPRSAASRTRSPFGHCFSNRWLRRLIWATPSPRTFARTLKDRFELELRGAVSVVAKQEPPVPAVGSDDFELAPEHEETVTDVLGTFETRAIGALRADVGLRGRLQAEGVPWGELMGYLAGQLPETLDNRDNIAYRLPLNDVLRMVDLLPLSGG